MRPSDIAVAIIELRMEKEEIVPTIVDSIRTKNNAIGLLEIFLKYIIPGRIKIEGSWGAATKIVKILYMVTHSMYKK